jgi:hypothetical protein
VVFGVGGLFADVEGFDDESFVDDGFIGWIVQEMLEHVAGAAPGGAEDEQDVFVLGGGGGLGLREDLVGGGLGVERVRKEQGGGEEGGAEEGDGAHGGLRCACDQNHYEGKAWADGDLWGRNRPLRGAAG